MCGADVGLRSSRWEAQWNSQKEVDGSLRIEHTYLIRPSRVLEGEIASNLAETEAWQMTGSVVEIAVWSGPSTLERITKKREGSWGRGSLNIARGWTLAGYVKRSLRSVPVALLVTSRRECGRNRI